MIRIKNNYRPCECCGSDLLESIWKYEHIAITRNSKWIFDVNNVICKECGFVFTSPVIDKNQAIEYYNDSYSRFSGQPLDYDIENRSFVIDKFVTEQSRSVAEIGGNVNSQFFNYLQSKFEEVINIEPNFEANTKFRSLVEVNDLNVDCVVNYFVLEHVPDVTQFFKKCYSLLNNNGILICEVPSIQLYPRYIAPLILFEHTNHFSSGILSQIASNFGFELIFESEDLCSRPFGFVVVFRKVSSHKEIRIANEYDQNIGYFLKGVEKANSFFDRIKLIKQWILNSKEETIIWAANDISNRLIAEIGCTLPDYICIIDSDPRKEKYFNHNPVVMSPGNAEKHIRKANRIIICTSSYKEIILNQIKKDFGKEFDDSNIKTLDLQS